MGTEEKSENTVDKMAGQAKEAIGDATGDESLERQGERQQSEADLKQAGEKVKDAFRKD